MRRTLMIRAVALFGPAASVPVFLAKGDTIVTNMEAEIALYPGLATYVTAFKADLADLRTKETAANGPTASSVATNERDDAHTKAFKSEEALRLNLQLLLDATPSAGATLVTKSGYNLRRRAVAKARTFRVDHGADMGTVQADIPAPAKRYSIEWAASADDGVTWVIFGSGPDASYLYEELTVGKTYAFRYRVTLPKKKPGNWSNVLKLTVK